jgi:hypothetical protein
MFTVQSFCWNAPEFANSGVKPLICGKCRRFSRAKGDGNTSDVQELPVTLNTAR